MRNCGDNTSMTDQAPPSAEQPTKKARKPYFVPFFAVIKVFSTVKLLDDDRAEIMLGGQQLTLPIAVSQREQVRATPLQAGEIKFVRLWFRTIEGSVTDLELAGFSPLKEGEGDLDKKPQFEIAGRIEAVNKEEGTVMLKIEPNSVTALGQAFTVEVWSSLELLEKVKRPGRTMIFGGEYRPGSGRLVVTSVKPKLVGQTQKKSEATTNDQ